MQYSEIEKTINQDNLVYTCLKDYINKECSYKDHICKGPLAFYFVEIKGTEIVRIRNFCTVHYKKEITYGREIKKLNEKDIFTIKILLENGSTN